MKKLMIAAAAALFLSLVLGLPAAADDTTATQLGIDCSKGCTYTVQLGLQEDGRPYEAFLSHRHMVMAVELNPDGRDVLVVLDMPGAYFYHPDGVDAALKGAISVYEGIFYDGQKSATRKEGNAGS